MNPEPKPVSWAEALLGERTAVRSPRRSTAGTAPAVLSLPFPTNAAETPTGSDTRPVDGLPLPNLPQSPSEYLQGLEAAFLTAWEEATEIQRDCLRAQARDVQPWIDAAPLEKAAEFLRVALQGYTFGHVGKCWLLLAVGGKEEKSRL